MTHLLITYTDWQADLVRGLDKRLEAGGITLLHIGRRTAPIASASVRSLRGFTEFEADGTLPLLDDPLEFERNFLSEYSYQLSRYSKGFARRAHGLLRPHEYRDHFHLTARKIKRYLIQREVETVLLFNIPHTGDDYLFYRVAEAMQLRTIMLFSSLLKNRFFSSPSITTFGQLQPVLDSETKTVDKSVLFDVLDQQLADQVTGYMIDPKGKVLKQQEVQYRLFAAYVILRRFPRALLNPRIFPNVLREVARLRRDLISRRKTLNYLEKGGRGLEYIEWLTGLESDPLKLPSEFVYFPLHFQPEMTTSPQGGAYNDQALAIEQLAPLLPKNVKLVVKENPKQGTFNREPEFLQRISSLPNVVIVHPSVSTKILEAKSKAIATITGTAGWEAIRAEKPCIVFGYPWYRSCPGVHQFTSDIDISSALNTPPQRASSEAFLCALVGSAHEGVIYEAYLRSDNATEVSDLVKRAGLEVIKILRNQVPLTFGE